MSQEAAGHVIPLETAARGRRQRWQTRIGRGDTDHNIYHIEDMERSECGASNGMDNLILFYFRTKTISLSMLTQNGALLDRPRTAVFAC